MKGSPTFVARPDVDGTLHVFCTTCLLTVANVETEAEAAAAGDAHECPGYPLAFLPVQIRPKTESAN